MNVHKAVLLRLLEFGDLFLRRVLEDCINWYYLNQDVAEGIYVVVLEDCINWYYLNKKAGQTSGNSVLEDCINWYYLNKGIWQVEW